MEKQGDFERPVTFSLFFTRLNVSLTAMGYSLFDGYNCADKLTSIQ